jgi:23S rRNA (guanine1835-N2)-methyltransferase
VMARLAPQANIDIYTDSYMSELGIVQNAKACNLDAHLQQNKIRIHSTLTLSEHPESPDLLLLKIPRTLSYLEYSLIAINKLIKDDSKIVAGAMVKLVTSSVMSLFDKYLANTTSSLARKKARLIFAEHDASKLSEAPALNQVSDPALNFTLYNYANVFCQDQVDIGARYLLQSLPNLNKQNHVFVDLGCGNGILGVTLLKQYPHAKGYFVDESYMAIASAKETYQQSGAPGTSEFLVSHSLSNLPDILHNDEHSLESDTRIHTDHANATGMIDTIICNPPFHQQNTVLDDIAWQMFVDAKKYLKVGGELRIVGNRHLDHRAKLSKLFGGCEVIASDSKFVVLSAKKTR